MLLNDLPRRFRRQFRFRPAALPLALLLLALAAPFLFGGDRAYFYRIDQHDWDSSKMLTHATNLSFKHNLLIFHYQSQNAAGNPVYPQPYSRFPLGGYVLLKLAILPFGEYDFKAKIYAGRMLMLLLFSVAAVLAYHSLARITGSRWDALTATLLAFSSYYLLHYADSISNEITIDLFAVMLAFHGMVIFVQEGRFRQLLIKCGAALLLGWHVYAFLLPFIVFGITAELLNSRRAISAPDATVLGRLKGYGATLLRSRYPMLGIVTLLLGSAILTFNFGNEYFALDGAVPLRELPSVQSAFRRTSTHISITSYITDLLQPGRRWAEQLYRVGQMTLPYAVNPYEVKFRYKNPEFTDYAAVALGVLAVGGCLAGLVGVRRRPGMRLLLATLAVSGFCWAIPLRRSVAQHDFESVFYIGIPLTLFALALLYLRRRSRGRLAPFFALAALAVFAASVSAMAGTGQNREELAVEAEQMAEYATIRELVDDGAAIYAPWYPPSIASGGARWASYYFLAGKPINYTDPIGDYLLLPMREDTPALLTPAHRHIFLYNRTLYDEWRRATNLGRPIIASDWQVYLRDGRLTYVSPECAHEDELFYLHFVPRDPADLGAGRKDYGYNNDDFLFYFGGVTFSDGVCVAERPLPDYDIAVIRTGQYTDAGRIWGEEYRPPAP